MVKEMSESQMTLIIDLLADVMAQESYRNDEDTKRLERLKEMVQETGQATSRQAGKALKDLKRLKVEGGNESRPDGSGKITDEQIAEINRLQKRQDHVPDKIEEQVRPLLNKFGLGRLGPDDANTLIELLEESQRKIREDFDRSKPM